MNTYELMYILKPNLEEAKLKAEKETLSKILTDNGAKISNIEEWGLRDLAYPIKKEVKGYYVVLKFTTNTNKAVSEFRRIVALNSSVIRFLITRD